MRLESRRVLNGDLQIVALDEPVEGPTSDGSHADAAPSPEGIVEQAQPDLGDADLARDMGFDLDLLVDQATADDVAKALPDFTTDVNFATESPHDAADDQLRLDDLSVQHFDTESAIAPSIDTADIHTTAQEALTSESATAFDTLAEPNDLNHSDINANDPLSGSDSTPDSDSVNAADDQEPEITPVTVESATPSEPAHESPATTVARGETATWDDAEPVVVTHTTTINGTLIAPHGVEVDDGGVLKGSGTIEGEVTLLSGGTLAPGNSPGIMNVNGLTLMAGGTLDIDVDPSYQTAGVHYDQFNVTGSVNLGGATLNLIGGAGVGSAGQVLTIIKNDGTDDVIGTFDGLADGALVTINSFTAYISYHGGDGNDVTLTTAYTSSLAITGTGAAEMLQVRRVGDTIQTLNGSTVTSATPLAALTGLTISGGGGNDQLTVNFLDDATTYGFLPITFNGGSPTTGPGDRLVIASNAGLGAFATITHNFTNQHDGSVNIDGSVITYTGLEPVTDNLSAVNRVFNFNGGAETITLTDAAGANMTISSTLGESVTFANPTTSLTINAGTGNDNVVLASVDSAYGGAITVDGGIGNDTITGPNGTVSWDVDAGTFTGTSFGATFLSMETLQGGSGADTFTVSNATLAVLRGGLGADEFVIDDSLTGASSVDGEEGEDTLRGNAIDAAVITIVGDGPVSGVDGTEASVGTGGWNNIDTIIGNGGSLTGRNVSSTWTLNALPTASTYMAGGFTLRFGGFTSLQGGSQADTFNLVTDPGAITLNGNLGIDDINISSNLATNNRSFTAETIAVGSVTIAGDQSYFGMTSLLGSTLNGNIVLGGNVTVGGTVNSSLTGQLDLGGVNRTFTVSSTPISLEIGATISNGSLTKAGGGTLVLSAGIGPNTFADTTISGGTVRLEDNDLLPGNLMIAGGGTLNVNGQSETINGLSGTGTLTNTAGLVMFQVGNAGATSSFGGVISGAIALTKIGAGTLTLSGSNTYSGDTTINQGTLKLAGGDVLPDGVGKGNLIIVAGAILDLNGSGEDINGLSGQGIVDNLTGSTTSTLSVGGNNQTSTFDGVIQNTVGRVALQKIGTGTLTLTGTNLYTGATTVSTGTLSITGSTAAGSAVTVNSGATLTGTGDGVTTGKINGSVTLSNGSQLDPGLAVGTLGTGSLSLASGSQLVVQVNGDTTAGVDYDQIKAVGTVNLGNATLSATGVIPLIGNTEIVLIDNDGADAVVGTFAGLAQGATVVIGGVTFQLSYTGGTGNDVVLRAGDTLVSLASGNLTITDINSTTNDNLVIKSNTALSRFEISDATGVLVTTIAGATLFNPNTVFVPFSAVVGTQINVLTGDGTDNLTVDLSSGNFAKTINYTAGNPAAGPGDRLTLTGGATFASVAHTFVSDSAGSVSITGNNTINYSELEGPITDSLVATARTFTFTGGTETITLSDFSGAGLNSIDSTLGATTTFANPTASVTINAGNGHDTINLTSLDAAYRAAVTINGGDGSDSITLNTALTLGSGTSTGAVSFTAETIDLNAAINTTAVTTGSITLAGTAISANSDLTTDGAAVTITAATAFDLDSSVTIDTESGNNGNAGAINFTGTGRISATASGLDLTLRSDTTSGVGGAVTLVGINNGSGAAINDLLVDSRGTTNGSIRLNGDISLDDDGAGTEASLTLAGNVSLPATRTFDTELGDTAGGGIVNLQNAIIAATGVGIGLTINADTTAAGMTGGTVTLGSFEPPTGTTRLANLTVNTNGPTKGQINVPVAVTTSGTITLQQANLVDIDADIAAGSGLTISDVATRVDLAAGVDLTAAGGTGLTIAANIAEIRLSGADGTANNLTTTGDRDLALTAIVATNNDVDLTVSSQKNVTLDTVNLNTLGSLTVNIDSDNDSANATLTANQLDAGAISLDGGNTRDDDATLNGTLTANGGAISMTDFRVLDLNADVTAATTLTISGIGTRVDLAAGVDLLAGGSVSAVTNVASILLSGTNGSANAVEANGEGNVSLGPVTATNTDVDLIVNAQGNITLNTVNLQTAGTLTLNVDDDNDTTNTLTTGALTAGTLNVDGGNDCNDAVTLNGAIVTTGNVTVTDAGSIDQNGTLNANGSVTYTACGFINIDGSLTAAAMPVTLTTTTAAGNINVNAAVTTTSGNIDINSGAAFTLANGSAVNSGSGDISIDTTGANVLRVNGDITTAGAGTIILTGSDAITQDTTSLIQTAAGIITLNSTAGITADVIESTGGANISLTSGTSILEADNSARIGAVGTNSLLTLVAGTNIGGSGTAAINTSIGTLDATTTMGSIFISEADGLTLDNVAANGAGNDVIVSSTTGNIAVDSVTAPDTIQLTATAGAIDEFGADAGADLIAATFDLDAVTGIGNAGTIEITATTITADSTGVGNIDLDSLAVTGVTFTSLTAGTGNITVDQTGGQTLTVTSGSTTAGSITFTNDNANLTATLLTAGGAGDVTLTTTTAGDVRVGSVTAAGNQITINSAAGIEESTADATADLIAATLDLNAATGIGDDATLEVTATTISADSTGTGNIDLDSLATTGVTFTSLTSGVGNITVDQTGNQTLDITLSTTVDGSISISNVNANLTVTAMTANGAGRNVTLTTTTGGDVRVNSVTAAGDLITINSAAGIEESGADVATDLIAATLDLNAVSGIGDDATLEVTANSITADSSGTGDVDLDSLAVAAVTVTSLTAVTGDITFDQTGGQTLAITNSVTTNGSITITNAGGDLTATTVTAGGTGRNVSLTTTTSGDIFVGSVTAAGDTITVNSAEAIEELGGDAAADLTAGTLDLDAVSGIGHAGTIELAASNIAADNTSAFDVRLANSLTTATNVTALRTTTTTGTPGGNIDFTQTGGGTGAVTFTGPVSSGRTGVNGGNITLTSDSGLTVAGTSTVNSADGTGGTLSINGATINGAITVGAGDITINGGGDDVIIDANVTASNDIDLTATDDIIIRATVTATGASDITLNSDSDNNGLGGVWLDEPGSANDARLAAGEDIDASGSDLATPVPADTRTTRDAIRIDNDGANQQLDAAGSITLTGKVIGGANPTTLSDIILDGETTSGVSLAVNAADSIYVCADQTAGDDITFSDVVIVTADITITAGAAAGNDVLFASTVNDDSIALTTSNVTINAGGETRFNGSVGGTSRLTSLTTDAAGTTAINAALVRTTGHITFGDDVTVEQSVTVDSSGGNVQFSKRLDDDGSALTASDVLINSANETRFNGSVGTIARLDSLTTDSAGTTVLNASDFRTIGNMTFNDAVTTETNVTLDLTTGDLFFGSTLNAAGNVTITNADDVTFTGTIAVTGNVNQQAGTGTTAFNGTSGGGITGALNVATDAVTFNTSDVVTGGHVTVTAQNAITLNAGGGINATAATISLLANQDAAGAEGFTQNATALLPTIVRTTNDTATAVSITVNTALGGTGNAAIGDLRAGTATAGRITITSAGGAITDNLTGEAANLTAFRAVLSAATGIGSADDIDTNLSQVQFTNTTSGAVQIQEVAGAGDNALEVLNGSNVTGNIDVRTTDGDLTISGAVTTTTAGAITLQAGDSDNDGNGDLNVNAAITAATGQVTLTSSGNDVTFSANGDVATTTGEIEVNAGATGVGLITMNDATLFNAGSGLIDLNGVGDVTLGQLVTTNATTSAVTVDSTAGGIIDAGDANNGPGTADIIALTGGIMLNAVTGIGALNAIETSAATISAINSGSADVRLANSLTTATTVTALRTTTTTGTPGGNIDFTQTGGGTGAVTFNGPVSSGRAGVNGGNITLTSDSGLTVGTTSTVSSADGTGGTLSINGATINGAITVGAGNITINGGGDDVIIDADITASNDIAFTATDDIIIRATVTATGAGSDITLNADSDNNGLGGVWLDEAGSANNSRLSAGGAVAISGSDLTTVVDTNLATGAIELDTRTTLDAIRIDADGTNSQITSGTTITLTGKVIGGANSTTNSDIILDGRTSAGTSLTVDADDDIYLCANQTAGDDITFSDEVIVTADITITAGSAAGNNVLFAETVNDDGNGTTASNVTINAGGETRFNGSVGNTSRLTSLTTDAAGTTVINATQVRAAGNITFGDDVTVEQSVTVDSSGGNVRFSKRLDDDGSGLTGSDVTINSANDTRFNGSVGTVARLNSLTTDAAGTTILNASDFRTIGNMTFNDAVTTETNVTLDLTTGDLFFGSTLNAAGNVTITNADDVTFTGTIAVTGNVNQQAGTGTTAFNGTHGGGITGTLNVTTNAVTFNTADVVTAGAVTVMAQNAITLNAGGGINATAATISLLANQDGAGAEGFTQNSTAVIRTTNDTAAAVMIAVGGTGNAAISDIRVGTATAGRITITSAGGAITENLTGEAANLTAFRAVLSAATGIGQTDDIDTTIAELDAMNSTSGNIFIDEANAISVLRLANNVANDNDQTTGQVSLHLAAGTITIAAGQSGVGTIDGKITLDADGTNSDAEVLAAITTTSTGSVMITADDRVHLSAAGDITASGTGGVMITANAVATDGDSNDELRLDDGAVIDAGSGPITLSTAGANGGDVTLGRLITTNATASAVTITSNANVVDGGDIGGADIEANGGTVNITAGLSIGAIGAGAIDTRIATLNATTTSGSIFIDEADGLTLATVTAAGADNDVTVSSTTGDIVVNAVTAPDTIKLTALGGGIEEATPGDATADLTAATLDLDATTGIGDDAAIEVTAATISADSTGTGQVRLNSLATAPVTFTSLTAGTGDITVNQTGGQSLTITNSTTTDGAITITNAGGNLTATSITAGGSGRNVSLTTTTSGDVQLGTVTATGDQITITSAAAITDSLAGEGANLIANNAVLSASTGIGSADDIDTDLSQVQFTNTTSGAVVIQEVAGAGDNPLEVTNGSNVTGHIDIRTTNGNLTIGAVSTTTAGTITLIANETDAANDDNLIVNGAISAAMGQVTLTSATNDVNFGANGDVTTSSGKIEVNAGIAGAGQITMHDGALLNAGSGLIDLNGIGDVTIGQLQTTDTTASAITVDSTTGAILDAGDTNNGPGTADVIAASGGVVMNAATGIGTGANGAIEMRVSRVAANVSGSGNLVLANDSAVTVTVTSLTTLGGDIQYDQIGGSDLFFTGAISSGRVSPAVLGGNITLTNDGNLTIEDFATPVSSQTGAGGVLTVSGAVINRSIVPGQGDITILGNSADLIVSVDITRNEKILLTARRDVIIRATVTALGVDSDVCIIADSDLNGVGGVWIDDTTPSATNARVNADRDVIVIGSDLFARADAIDSIRVDSDGTAQQVVAGRHVSLTSRTDAPVPAGAEIVLNGKQTATAGNITISGKDGIRLGDDGDLTTSTGFIQLDGDLDNNGVGNITMTDATLVDAGSGYIDLTAANVVLGTLKTTSSNGTTATNPAVKVVATHGAISDAGSTAVNIDATVAGAGTVLQAVTGIGASNPLEIQSSFVSADVSGAGDLNLAVNSTTDVTVTSLTSVGGNITLEMTGTGDLFFTGTVSSGSTTPVVNGGNITLTNFDGDLTVAAFGTPVTSEAGTGGVLVVGNATINRSIVLGQGNITINGEGLDLIITVDMVRSETTVLSAKRDVIILATVTINGSASDLIITADSDMNGVGGFWLNETTSLAFQDAATRDARLTAGRDIVITGSDLFADPRLFPGDTRPAFLTNVLDSIRIDGEGITQQIVAGRHLSLASHVDPDVPAGAEILIQGRQTATTGNATVAAKDGIQFTDDGDLTATAFVQLNGDQNADGTGNITMTDGALIDASAGHLDLSAANIVLGGLKTTSTNSTTAANPAVKIVATRGSITDSVGDELVNIDANGVGSGSVLRAVTGIGTGNALETRITRLDAQNLDRTLSALSAGNIEIREVASGGDLELLNVHNQADGTATGDTLNGVINVTVDGGHLTVMNDGGSNLLAEFGATPPGTARAAVFSENTIRLTAQNVTIHDDLQALDDTAGAAGIDERIEINARGNFTLDAGRVISTDDRFAGSMSAVQPAKPRTSGDVIRIAADADSGAVSDTSTTDGEVFLGQDAMLSTDAGLEQALARRPDDMLNSTGTAFFEFDSIQTSGLNFNGSGLGGSQYLGFLTVVVGVAGEQNLILEIDWGDLTPAGQSNVADPTENANNQLAFNPAVDQFKTRFVIPEGGREYKIPHQYTEQSLNVTTGQPGRNGPTDPFQVRFSVSQHNSITVLGQSIYEHTPTPTGTPIAVEASAAGTVATGPLGLLSSTDVRDVPINPDARFDNGVAEFKVPRNVTPTMPRVEVPPSPAETPKFFIRDEIINVPPRVTTEILSSGAVSSSILTDEFYELRRFNEDGTIVTERLNEFSGEALLDQAKLEEFMQERGDGDYEIWFATKDARDGAQLERRVMRFRFQDFHIVPTTSETPNLIPEQKLVPQPPADKPAVEPPEQPPGANGNDFLEADAVITGSHELESTEESLPVWEPGSLGVLPEISSEPSEIESPTISGQQTTGAVILLTAATWRRRRRTSTDESSTFSKSSRFIRRCQRS